MANWNESGPHVVAGGSDSAPHGLEQRPAAERTDSQYGPVPPAAPPRQQRTRGWASAPATYVLLGINCSVFVAMVLSGISISSPQPEQLIRWGADYGPYVLALGQWWRLFTAMFLHIGVLHLATNMWCLWNLGLLGEPLLGAWGLFAAYLLTGFAGNLLSIATHPGLRADGAGAVIGAGASGAIFGLAGLLIILLNSSYLPLPPADRKALRKNVIWFAVLNFVLAFGVDLGHFSTKIDNTAHLGGFWPGSWWHCPWCRRSARRPPCFGVGATWRCWVRRCCCCCCVPACGRSTWPACRDRNRTAMTK